MSPHSAKTAATLPDLPAALRAQGRHSILLRWVMSRAFALLIMSFVHEGDVVGDVTYYARNLRPLFLGASTHYTLQEYPLPVVALMAPQYLLAWHNGVLFAIFFAVSMLAVDAFFTGLLWRADQRKRGDATDFWLWFVPLVGPLAFFRFDLVPAVLVGGAVLAAVRRPAIAGALTALGAAIKLWPIVLLPAFLLRRADRRPVLLGFAGVGLALSLASLLAGGVARNVSPLYWQSSRGLQIESVPAMPLMAARAVSHHTWRLGISKYKSWEIFGPGVAGLVTLSTLLTVLGGLVLAALWWRAYHSSTVTGQTLGWIFISTTLIVMITNRALSPQYLLWVGGPTAALAARSPSDPAVRNFARLVLVTALATQLTYPIGYQQLTMLKFQMPLWATILVLRNLLLMWLTWLAVRKAWQSTSRQVPVVPQVELA